MSGDFLDTNVFVYLFDRTNERKRLIAESVVSAAIAGGEARISHQIIQETLNVITTKMPTRVSVTDARDFLDRVLLPLWRGGSGPTL